MSGKWSTPKRCNCKDPVTGRDLGRTCPKLSGRRHGTVGYNTRIPTSRGTRELRRFGFDTKTAADMAAGEVWELIGLGRQLDKSETFGEAWSAWLAGRRKARPSYV